MKKYIILLFSISLLGSCESFLEEKPYDFLSEQNFYKNEKDASIGLNGAFGILQSQNYYQRTVWLVSELQGDYLQVNGTNAVRQEIQDFTFTGANSEITNWWVNSYTMIARVNELIEQVPLIAMDDKKKNNIVGNARFLRGVAYFDLVRSFGRVPLIVSSIKSTSGDMKPSPSPIADIYAQIIEDLQFAELNCALEKTIPASDKGRISSGAAASLLAKVFLTRASSSAAQTGDYQAALDACNRVITSNQYQLISSYPDLFDVDPAKENGPEHIFSVQFDMPPNIGNITIQMLYPIESSLIGGQGAGVFRVNPAFATSYAPGDQRGTWNVTNKSGSRTLGYYFFYKYKDASRKGNDSRMNWIVLRYADVLLMQSEAMNNINTLDPNKFQGINAVRQRAGLLPLDFTTTPSQNDFVNALLRERAWELCMEGHRKYDLLRMGKLKEVQKSVNNRDIDDSRLLFPIPQTEVLLNPNLAE